MRPVQPCERVSGDTYLYKTPPTARKIPPVSAVPQLARLGGGWCSLEPSGLGKSGLATLRKRAISFFAQPLGSATLQSLGRTSFNEQL